jgi:hypothetical protein
MYSGNCPDRPFFIGGRIKKGMIIAGINHLLAFNAI